MGAKELREKLNTVSSEIYEISKLIDGFTKIRNFDMVEKFKNALTVKEYEAIRLKELINSTENTQDMWLCILETPENSSNEPTTDKTNNTPINTPDKEGKCPDGACKCQKDIESEEVINTTTHRAIPIEDYNILCDLCSELGDKVDTQKPFIPELYKYVKKLENDKDGTYLIQLPDNSAKICKIHNGIATVDGKVVFEYRVIRKL